MKNEYVSKLELKAKELGVYPICERYLTCHQFPIWSGSAIQFAHHYGTGGLAKHTCEVVDLCFLIKDYFGVSGYSSIWKGDYLVQTSKSVDPVELFLSAFFHDLGKLHDYEPRNGKWEKKDHCRKIHHISRSGIIWAQESIKDTKIHKEYFEDVLHAILSHHGRRELGSPVAPKSRVSWILHHCDALSARYDDADTLDVVIGEVK